MAGKRKGRFLVVAVIGIGGLIGSHYWAMGKIEEAIRTGIQEETAYPPILKGFTGMIPTGSFSLDYLEVKSQVEENLLELKTSNVSLHIDPAKYLSGQYELKTLDIEAILVSFSIPEENLKLNGRFEVDAKSSVPGPLDNPEGSLWAQEAEVRLDSLTAALGLNEWDILSKAALKLMPLNIVPEEGLRGPVEFDFKGLLTPNEESNLLLAKGNYDSASQTLEIDATLSSVVFPTRIKWLEEWLRGQEGVEVAELIESGSLSYRISGSLEGDVFKGNMTLRLLQPHFGKELRVLVEEFPIGTSLLDLLEEGVDPIEIGPIEIDENLVTPEIESATLILAGLTREFFELNSRRGPQGLLDLFGAKQSSKPKEN